MHETIDALRHAADVADHECESSDVLIERLALRDLSKMLTAKANQLERTSAHWRSFEKKDDHVFVGTFEVPIADEA